MPQMLGQPHSKSMHWHNSQWSLRGCLSPSVCLSQDGAKCFQRILKWNYCWRRQYCWIQWQCCTDTFRCYLNKFLVSYLLNLMLGWTRNFLYVCGI